LQGNVEREIESLRLLEHPLICGIIDIIKDEHNFPYIIMEKYDYSLEFLF